MPPGAEKIITDRCGAMNARFFAFMAVALAFSWGFLTKATTLAPGSAPGTASGAAGWICWLQQQL